MLISLLFFQGAHAGDLEYGYRQSLGPGEQPALMVSAPRALEELSIQCAAGGAESSSSRRGLAAGASHVHEWPRDPNVTEANCMVHAIFADGFEEIQEVPVQYSYAGGLSVDYSAASADFKKHTVTVGVTGWVDRADVVAYGAKKRVLGRESYAINAGPGNVEVPWVGNPAEVVLLEVKFHSSQGWASFEYSPWMLDIPHDDVNFQTNEAVIAADQYSKLEHTLSELKEVIEQYGDIVPVKLFIGGCTDTVGTVDSNRTLSKRRARAIAQWFRNHGYDRPIYYYGFGEKWLKDATGDGVDSIANRRAVYIVGANPPPPSSGVPAASWIALD